MTSPLDQDSSPSMICITRSGEILPRRQLKRQDKSNLTNHKSQSCPQVGIGPTVHEGVLTISGGPNYESVAELKMFSMLGVDCVGKTDSL